MDQRLRVTSLIAVVLLLAACGPAPATRPATQEPGAVQIELVDAAQEALADQLAVDPETIRLVRVEDAQWPDSCLGLPAEGEACAEAITPGFLVVLGAQGSEYVFRTDTSGSLVRLERKEG